MQMHDDDAVVYYEDLLTQFGIKISRTHLKRLEDAGKIPKRIKTSLEFRGSRFFYPRRLIKLYAQGKWRPDDSAELP
jgi:hypothetical protein